MEKEFDKNICFIGVFLISIVFLSGSVSAQICEALESYDCYYVATNGSDSNPGSFEEPFATVKHGINIMNPGDYLYMRGGTYNEHINLMEKSGGRQGSESAWYTVKSYPGEWAIVDGQHSEASYIFYYVDGGPDYCPQYWRFEHFEVTGGGVDTSHYGGGFRFDTGRHISFDYMYIHDNFGYGGSNNAGICFPNEDGAAQHITITNSYLKDNACEEHNCANINLFSDYRENISEVDINNALQKNEIAYNLVIGSEKGIKYKNLQYLTLSHNNPSMEYKDLGDKIHHNIVLNATHTGISARHDFIQAHHNIVNSRLSVGAKYTSDRTPLYAVVYNNLIMDERFTLDQDIKIGYEPPYSPYFYGYNNIIENSGEPYNGRNDVNFLFTWNHFTVDDVNVSSITFENNYIYPVQTDKKVINLVDNENDYTAAEYIQEGYSEIIYIGDQDSSNPLHQEKFKPNLDHQLSDGKTLQNGGIGGAHPYFDGMEIPDYMGPCPDTECSWVDQVSGLSDITNLIENTNLEENICGDSVCNGTEDCSNCPLDCLDSETEVCCSGIAYSGECCSNNDCNPGDECNTTNHLCQEIQQNNSLGSINECKNWQQKHPEWLWCDGFEDNLSLTDKYEDTGLNGLSVSSDDSYSGSKSIKQHYDSDQTNAGWIAKYYCDALGEDYGDCQDEIYMRWHHKFEEGFEGMPPKMARIRDVDPGWNKMTMVAYWIKSSDEDKPIFADVYAPHSSQSNDVDYLPQAISDFNYSDPENIGRWTCHEMYIKQNTPGNNDGKYVFWADGKEIIRRENVDLLGDTSQNLNYLMLDAYFNGGSPKPQNRYFDNWVVSTERIGCANLNNQTTDFHPADINPKNGVVSFIEIEAYMNRWLNGEITLNQLLEGINEWRGLG